MRIYLKSFVITYENMRISKKIVKKLIHCLQNDLYINPAKKYLEQTYMCSRHAKYQQERMIPTPYFWSLTLTTPNVPRAGYGEGSTEMHEFVVAEEKGRREGNCGGRYSECPLSLAEILQNGLSYLHAGLANTGVLGSGLL